MQMLQLEKGIREDFLGWLELLGPFTSPRAN